MSGILAASQHAEGKAKHGCISLGRGENDIFSHCLILSATDHSASIEKGFYGNLPVLRERDENECDAPTKYSLQITALIEASL